VDYITCPLCGRNAVEERSTKEIDSSEGKLTTEVVTIKAHRPGRGAKTPQVNTKTCSREQLRSLACDGNAIVHVTREKGVSRG